MKTDPVIVPVIMSGGAGTRLWPLSTRAKPKQLHALTGHLTLLQQTVLRCPQTQGFAAPMVVCAARHADQIRTQCNAVNTAPAQIITEPCPRNTAPCAVTAALAVRAHYGDEAQVLLLAADHYMANPDAFRAAVKAGASAAATGHIVTFGAHPTGPATGYGYIRKGKPIDQAAFAVDRFVEKPDKDTAKSYVQSGEYVWNAGIFLYQASLMLDEIKTHRPAIYEAAAKAWEAAARDGDVLQLDAAAFAACPSESVDYAVMENTHRAALVALDAGWSDVGAWPAIYDLTEKNEAGNACHGKVLAVGTKNSLLYSDGPLIATLGVSDLAVIATDKATLVVPMDQADNIKALIAKLHESDL